MWTQYQYGYQIMLNWNSNKNKFTTSFLLFFAVFGGVWTALYIATIVQFKATSILDVVIFVYWLLPTILTVLCLAALKYRQMASAILWICACYWLLISAGELIESNAIQPNIVLIVLAFVFSVTSLAHLVAAKIVEQ